jgi:hypothetical protein
MFSAIHKRGQTMRQALRLASILALCSLAVGWAQAPPARIGAVVQTWKYDPLTNTVTLKIVNNSHKDITAFNIAIKEPTPMGVLNNMKCWKNF